MSLRKLAEQKAEETAKATKRIGLVAQLTIEAGIAPHGRGITNVIRNEAFRPYSDESEEKTRKIVHTSTEAAIKHLPVNNFAVGPVLKVAVVQDTSLTPTSRWTGGSYSMKPYDKADRFTHKRHSDFIFDYMSPEIDELGGKKFWAHVAWQRLDEDHGGDYTLDGDAASDELSIIITYLENKRAATELVKNLREGVTDTDALCIARGYPLQTVRAAMKAAREVAEENATKPAAPTLSDIGELTKRSHMTLQGFTEPKTVEFLQQNYDKANGDLQVVKEKCGAEIGDIAIVLNKPEYFRELMTATGLAEVEAVAKVAGETGLANAADLAKFLGIEEAAF